MKTPSQIILEAHRDNLKAAKTFEEFQSAHVMFVELLIAKENVKHQEDELDIHFLEGSVT